MGVNQARFLQLWDKLGGQTKRGHSQGSKGSRNRNIPSLFQCRSWLLWSQHLQICTWNPMRSTLRRIQRNRHIRWVGQPGWSHQHFSKYSLNPRHTLTEKDNISGVIKTPIMNCEVAILRLNFSWFIGWERTKLSFIAWDSTSTTWLPKKYKAYFHTV